MASRITINFDQRTRQPVVVLEDDPKSYLRPKDIKLAHRAVHVAYQKHLKAQRVVRVRELAKIQEARSVATRNPQSLVTTGVSNVAVSK